MKRIIGIACACSMMVGAAMAQDTTTYHEPYRPQYHFSPKQGWIGDPSGLMYYQGKFHMYWWGKVESTDLVHYDEVSPMVMSGASDNIAYFTGSAVVDKNNTAGYGSGAYVAAYTIYEKDSKKQCQGISFSHDGRHFNYYDQNPVIDLWSTEFRDPTVFWHEPTGKWVMVVAKALEKKVKFYTSPDLKHWTWTSDFGPWGDSWRSWECPDLFQVAVDGNPSDKRWVMVVSVNWAQEQYFVGNFDGERFTLADSTQTDPLYVDKGLDYYASRTFQDFDGTLTDKYSLGWIATWDYAPQAPSTYGKGFWSLPHVLGLKTTPQGLRLTQQPAPQLQTLRGRQETISQKLPVGTHRLPRFAPKSNVYELDATFSTLEPNTFGFNLCVGGGRKVVVSYDTQSHNLVIDRTHSTDAVIPKFARMANARVEPTDGKLRLHIFVDKSSIEIFAGDGQDVFTLLTYAADDQTAIETWAQRPGTSIALNAWSLNSAWK